MRQYGDRKIKVKKSDLLDKIKENKKNHIETYAKAVVAYEKEALKQLEKQIKRVKDGKLDAELNLVTPELKDDEYDKLILMFEMDVRDEVELSQQEFNQYVHDETDFAITSLMSNTAYLG